MVSWFWRAATGRHRGVLLLRELREHAFYQTLGWWPADGPVSYAEPSRDERDKTVPRPRRCRHRLAPTRIVYSQRREAPPQSYSQSAAESALETPLPPIGE